jgi:hypothetical protein
MELPMSRRRKPRPTSASLALALLFPPSVLARPRLSA